MRILIVEDEWLVAENLRELLQEFGHLVATPARTVVEALARLQGGQADLAIVDTRLADGPSERVIEQCKRLGIPVVISSGHALDDLPAFALGYPLLAKPFSDDDVRMAVDAAFALGS